jgi:hypothetical protein
VLAYQYLQALPQIANGTANKVWVVPVEMTRALEGLGGVLGNLSQLAGGGPLESADEEELAGEALAAAQEAARAAEAVREDVRQAERTSGAGSPRQLAANAVPAAEELADREQERA